MGRCWTTGCGRWRKASSPGSTAARKRRWSSGACREKGPVKVPREFVFMDRAAIGLGGVFLHLNAHLNYYRLFNETIEDFDQARLEARQKEFFGAAGVPLPVHES